MRSLTRWTPRHEMEANDPFRPLEQIFEEMWRGLPFNGEGNGGRTLMRPAMDVIENDQNVTIRLDLPGMKNEDVSVEIEDNILTISGQQGDTIEKEGDRYHYRERYSGSFRRSLRLPNTIDADKVDASFENGVLNILLPKVPQAQPKRIEIKTGKK